MYYGLVKGKRLCIQWDNRHGLRFRNLRLIVILMIDFVYFVLAHILCRIANDVSTTFQILIFHNVAFIYGK